MDEELYSFHINEHEKNVYKGQITEPQPGVSTWSPYLHVKLRLCAALTFFPLVSLEGKDTLSQREGHLFFSNWK